MIEPTADPLPALQRYFGHASFRPGQRDLVETVLKGRDLLAVMPTGSGKSLGFQLPAVLLPGLTDPELASWSLDVPVAFGPPSLRAWGYHSVGSGPGRQNRPRVRFTV